jgi:hypothetical protein
MPSGSESDFEDFSVMIDPIRGKVSLLCPAPVIGFNDIHDFREFVLMLQSWIPALEGRYVGKEPTIDALYAKKVLVQWEKEIKKATAKQEAPQPGPKKSGNKPKTSLGKEPQ